MFMQIMKIATIIATLTVIASIGIQQTAFATSDNFKVIVTLDGVDSLTGRLKVEVTMSDGTGATRTVDPFSDGYTGVVKLDPFVFDADSTKETETFDVCVISLDYNVDDACERGEHAVNKDVSRITVNVPSGIGRENDKRGDITYYDENGNPVEDDGEFVPSVSQGDDSTVKEQGPGVDVSFGDDSDHNTVNIDQRSTFADVIRDLVPIAKKGAHMAKDTAVQLLN
jgi:hypothetical protein